MASLILGHQKILDFFRRSVQNNSLAHAYLFLGSEHLGKKTVALEFARVIQCENRVDGRPCDQCRNCKDISRGTHPDVILIAPEASNSITIAQARKLRQDFSLSPYCAKYKIAILDEAQKISQEAADALLKTLEEPKGNSIIILVSSDPGELPETILSRLWHIRFSPVSLATIQEYFLERKNPKMEARALDDLIKLSRGQPGVIFNFLQNPDRLKKFQNEISGTLELLNQDFASRCQYFAKVETLDDFRKVLANEFLIFENLLAQKSGARVSAPPLFFEGSIKKTAEKFSISKIIEIIKFLQRLNRLSLNYNFNYRLALEVLMLKI